jgi:hypothetical protein
MERIFAEVCILAACVLCAACAASPSANAPAANQQKTPLWVTDREAAYPNGQWLCAVESGRSKNEAEEAELSSLSQSFRVDIAASEQASQAFFSAAQKSGGKTMRETGEFSGFSREVNAVSQVAGLIGVERDAWISPSGEVWAAARMNRAECSARYGSLAAENEKLIALLLDNAKSMPETFDACANLAFAASVAELTDNYYAVLSVLRTETAGKAPAYGGSGAIKAQLQTASRSVPVAVNVNGDVDGRIAKAFSQVFASRGFRTGSGGQAHTLRADFKTEDSEQVNKDNIFVRYTITAALTAPGGKELLSWSQNDREGHLLREEARQRAIRGVERRIAEDGFAAEFDAWFASLL